MTAPTQVVRVVGPELDALPDDAPCLLPITGHLPARDLLVNDFLHDPCFPGRVLGLRGYEDEIVSITVWTQGVWCSGTFHTVRVPKRYSDMVEVTRIVDQDLEPA